ncbi:hypothetical protein LIX60_14880 [Streptomyces sp. S07_1.15]|uniref:hypothetical protein n=1 Tax=Streptomyces sp. S07_1.15 TaxID=2873925 RepID=UPI001D141B24|nr:hypothetical protein [Streptomyces sp. S07_1.15]MCC3652723.1 hypothetical protein [Streptomyces sp. S07_1.15]
MTDATDGPDGRPSNGCETCGRDGRDVQPRHIIGGTGTGWTVVLCDDCAGLPPDPGRVPAGVDAVLLRTAERRRRARGQ